MSFFSSIIDGIFGDGSSDSAISGIKDSTGINLDFGLSTTPSTKEDPSFLSQILTPTNIIGGLGAYSKISGMEDAEQATKDKGALEMALMDKKFEQEKALLALKASLGGGGGGGGSGVGEQLAHDARKTRYLGVQNAMEQRSNAQLQSSATLVDAIKNLTDAAQRPLVR